VADKFHIIKQLLDACQDVRVRYRQELLTDKRLKYEAFKKQEHARKQELKQKNKAFIAQKFTYEEPTASNGETMFELLARRRYKRLRRVRQWQNPTLHHGKPRHKGYRVLLLQIGKTFFQHLKMGFNHFFLLFLYRTLGISIFFLYL